MISYDREFLESGRLRWDLIIANEDMPLLLRALDDLKAKGKTVPYEGKYVRRDSTRGPALFAAWRLDKTEAVIYTISVTSRN